jgi:hypothetical protein
MCPRRRATSAGRLASWTRASPSDDERRSDARVTARGGRQRHDSAETTRAAASGRPERLWRRRLRCAAVPEHEQRGAHGNMRASKAGHGEARGSRVRRLAAHADRNLGSGGGGTRSDHPRGASSGGRGPATPGRWSRGAGRRRGFSSAGASRRGRIGRAGAWSIGKVGAGATRAIAVAGTRGRRGHTRCAARHRDPLRTADRHAVAGASQRSQAR